jgi:catechol 2,3-dioxygenase-like lactoylglutathione lyase family enzyme
MHRLSHVNVTMPPGHEAEARRFYGELLRLREIPKPESLRSRGGCWFDAGGLDVHVSADAAHNERSEPRHFGLEVKDVAALRTQMEAAGVAIDPGRPAPWKRFFVRDPFGNRIELHEIGGLQAG